MPLLQPQKLTVRDGQRARSALSDVALGILQWQTALVLFDRDKKANEE